MDPTPRHLRKADVEALLRAVSGPATSALEEVAVVRHALRPALIRVLGADPEATWREVVDAAAARGAWTARRTHQLHGADAPQDVADVESVLEALWDLVTELNEVRDIERPATT